MANILIVDDNATNRSLLVTLLGYGGHCLREAADGAEALALVSSEHPDLVITDILMPTMDGYEFVRQLRSNSEIAHTPVIFCTAHFRAYDAKDLAQQCGVEHVLVKPCDPDTVMRIVEACLNKIGPAPARPVAEDFGREHLRLLMDKLTEQTDKLTIANLRLEALIETALQLASEREPGRLIEEFCKSARQLISAKFALAGVLPDSGQAPSRLAVAGLDWESYPSLQKTKEVQAAVAGLIQGQRPVRANNPGGDPAALGFPPDCPSFDSILAAPIVSPSRTFGWFCLLHRLGAVEFTEEDERLAGILGALAGRIYENGSLYAVTQQHGVEMEQELIERRRAEAALEERRRSASFGAEMGVALTQALTTPQGLQLSAEAFVRGMDVAFARIWMLNEKTNELELQASAGVYIDTDGAQGRLLIGQLEIGRIAQSGTPHLNNDVPNDPEVGDPEWARLEGIVAFAGYPLSVEGRMVGVVAAWGRQPFGEPVLQAFASVSIQLSQFITRKRAEEENRRFVEELKAKEMETLRAQAGREEAEARAVLAEKLVHANQELEEASRKLKETQAQLIQTEKMASLGQLVAGIAHEINNPLAFVLNNLFIVENGLDRVIPEAEPHLSEPSMQKVRRVRARLAEMNEGLNRVKELVVNLRTFSRLDEGEFQTIDVGESIDSVLLFLKHRMNGCIHVDKQYGSVRTLYCYAGRLNQVLMNLISNAVESIEGAGRIVIKMSQAEGQFVISVRDSGAGIPEAIRSRIFDPFFTTKPVGQGTGLGLAIAYGIVQDHHGSIEVRSEPGAGSEFTVKIPMDLESRKVA
jgi:signal transduction histidine kinase/DNA-binding response OmpR family regulator